MLKEDWDVLLTLAKDYGGLDPVKPHGEYYTNELFDCKSRGSRRRARRPCGPEYV
jgi:hypothetical protein